VESAVVRNELVGKGSGGPPDQVPSVSRERNREWWPMPQNPRKPPVYYGQRLARPYPRYVPSRREVAKKSGWDKAAVIVQAAGGLAIIVSLVALLIGVRQFNLQQKASAEQQLNQQRQDTLSDYLNDMSGLVLNYGLTKSKPSAPVRAIADARTITAVRDLDGDRKATLIRYLWEAHLITQPNPVLNLFNADLNDAVFTNANLYQIYLSQVSLSNAVFTDARLLGAYLHRTVLIQANLAHANLECYEQITCTNLSGAYLMRANLTDAKLSGADLAGADLSGANLRGADLSGVNLHDAIYNTKPIPVLNEQGKLVIDKPTQWPSGFDPKIMGAKCFRCS
jgi:Pentapeptide repeats (8 copies)